MRFLVVVLVLVVLSSCGPAAKLRRAERLIKKAEELGAVWHVDSVEVEIPVPVPEIRTDTVFQIKPGKTVTVEKDRLKVIIKRLPGDTIRVEAECKADTVRIKRTITINKTIKAESKIKWYHLLAAFGIGVGAGLLLRLFRLI